LVIELTLALRRNPVPYLLAVAMASNIGSTATITGNPQNMMIGSLSRISYVDFAATLAPVAVLGLVLTIVLFVLLHRGEFVGGIELTAPPKPAPYHRVLMWRALAATLLVVALHHSGQRTARSACD
jgi:Na+/H+ antiporter NhaD/arsenite permease-like protein